MSSLSPSHPSDREPAWDVAHLFPPQGLWSEADYLELSERTNRLVEFTDGCIEVLDTPTQSHQLLVRFLVDVLRAFVEPRRLGEVLFAPLRVRIRASRFREPDVVFMHADHAQRRTDDYWDCPDLVMEVTSKDPRSRRRDLERKRSDYAEAGIAEYWIVDTTEQQITVLQLEGRTYSVHGQFGAGEQATSRVLDGFSIDVTQAFRASDA